MHGYFPKNNCANFKLTSGKIYFKILISVFFFLCRFIIFVYLVYSFFSLLVSFFIIYFNLKSRVQGPSLRVQSSFDTMPMCCYQDQVRF